MALIKCPECGREISDKAESCPGCGCPGSEFKSTVDQVEVPEENPNKCTSCGHINSTEDDYCEKCRMRMTPYKVVVNRENEEKPLSEDELNRIADEVCLFYKNNSRKAPNAILELRRRTGMNAKMADDMIYMRLFGKTRKEHNAEQKAMRKAESQQVSDNFWNSVQGLSNALSKDKTARCPKCGSTSIQYANKKLSVGRGLVGYGVAGPAGAVLGGLSSKKGYAVCLKCGKQWKI